ERGRGDGRGRNGEYRRRGSPRQRSFRCDRRPAAPGAVHAGSCEARAGGAGNRVMTSMKMLAAAAACLAIAAANVRAQRGSAPGNLPRVDAAAILKTVVPDPDRR